MPKISNVSTVTVKGQVVIPIAIRKHQGIRPGSRISFSEEGDTIVVRPITEHSIRRLMGVLPAAGNLAGSLVRDRERDLKRDTRRR